MSAGSSWASRSRAASERLPREVLDALPRLRRPRDHRRASARIGRSCAVSSDAKLRESPPPPPPRIPGLGLPETRGRRGAPRLKGDNKVTIRGAKTGRKRVGPRFRPERLARARNAESPKTRPESPEAARQAGGHWFEPSSAHGLETALRSGFLVQGVGLAVAVESAVTM